MSLDLRAMLRTYTPGRRLRFKPESEAVRDKVPPGVERGVILQVIPLPAVDGPSSDPDRDPLPATVIGLIIEIERASGPDEIMLGADDVLLEPMDLETLREELLHRMVRFARSSGIGIAFPAGADDDGQIEDVRYRREEDGRQIDLAVSLRVPVDPAENPDGLDVFRTEADFTQCRLWRRASPAK